MRVSCHIPRQKKLNFDEKGTRWKVGQEARGTGDSLKRQFQPGQWMLPPDWAETNVDISGGQKVHGPSRVCLYEAYLNAIFSLRLRQSVWQSNQEYTRKEVDRKSSFWFDWLF